MLEQLIYKNHMNEVFEFGKDGIFVDTSELHDYEWQVTKKNDRISALKRGVVKRKLPVVIICKTEAEGVAAKNRLLEVVEKDALAMKHGKIIVGQYYFRCFVTKSKKKDYLITKRYMKLTLTLTSDFPYWVKEETFTFRKLSEDTGGKNLDFAHGHPFDYSSGMGNKKLNNTGFVPTDFKMIIYGACTDPAVYVAGHLYQVFCEVKSGEYLTIDSVTKRIYLTAVDGTTTNVFHLRNRENYAFEKMPSGTNAVIWEGDFGVDIVLLEERSEPKWI